MMKGPVYDNGKMNNRIFPLAIVLYVLLRYTDYDYLFGIFKLFLRWENSSFYSIITWGRSTF